VFFFEKKNQKTFVRLLATAPKLQVNKVFLLLFLQKKKASCLIPCFAPPAACPAGIRPA